MARTWFITGASSGFGLRLAERLLDRGDRLVATFRRDSEALQALAARGGERLRTVRLDLTDVPAIGRVVDETFAALGRVDVVVSNAGYGLFGAAEELTSEQVREVVDTNLIGSVEVIRAALPHLRGQGGGRVLQVSSGGGQCTYPGFSLYHAAKWGVEGFVDSVAQEVAGLGIQFTLVEPGPSRTRFSDNVAYAAPLDAYADTPVEALRRLLRQGRFSAAFCDPDKIVQAMIDSVDADPAPRRLALGSTAFEDMEAALSQRLRDLQAQEAKARAADAPAA